MFTGIVQATADVQERRTENDIQTLTLTRPEGWELTIGQSIAMNGVCLTVTRFDDGTMDVDLMPETLKRSSFGPMPPERVNLERAMQANAMLEGHIVQGHVDQVGTIVKIEESDQWRTLRISYPKEKAALLVTKGSITLDGISLTIVDVADDWFSVSLIPHTLEVTTIGQRVEGDLVNVEYDILAKLVQRNLQTQGGTNEN